MIAHVGFRTAPEGGCVEDQPQRVYWHGNHGKQSSVVAAALRPVTPPLAVRSFKRCAFPIFVTFIAFCKKFFLRLSVTEQTW